jgi:hypothetical protein
MVVVALTPFVATPMVVSVVPALVLAPDPFEVPEFSEPHPLEKDTRLTQRIEGANLAIHCGPLLALVTSLDLIVCVTFLALAVFSRSFYRQRILLQGVECGS